MTKADQGFRLLQAAGDVHRVALGIESARRSLAAAGESTDIPTDPKELGILVIQLDSSARSLLKEAQAELDA